MSSNPDTIFALSSGALPAAIAVVRISGPRAGEALAALTGRLPAPRAAKLARVRDPRRDEPIDDALVLWFPGPNSETGEDVAELQLHGGRAVLAAVFDTLASMEGLRPAQAGEFTRRAFLNGKLDLTAVEGLADLVGAETDAQRRQAYRQLKGLLGNRAEDWRTRLVAIQALIEAGIDFADEGDVPETLLAPALAQARALGEEIAQVLAQARHGERVRDGFVVAIAGPPNAGKSTLLNRLARREAAIVSPHAGTTRDVIEVHLDLDGYPVTLLDTAGVRASEDPVEQEGVRRALARAAEADLVLWVEAGEGEHGKNAALLAGSPPPLVPGADLGAGIPGGSAAPRWRLRNKADLPHSKAESESHNNEYEFTLSLSALTGDGVSALVDRLRAYVRETLVAEPGLVTRQRHRLALEAALAHLARLETPGIAEEIAAEEIRLAGRELARLTGRIDIEDILDVIFRDFCIGK